MVTGRYGARYVPGRASSLIGGAVIVGFGIFWTATAAGMGGPGFLPLFGVLFVLIGILISVVSYFRADQYAQAHQRYQKRRATLMNRGDAPGPPR